MDNNDKEFSQLEVIPPLQVEITLKPKAVSLYIQQAYNRFAQGDIEGAIADFNIALCIHPNSAELYTARANFRKKKLGDRLGAIEDYTQAIFINPDNAFFYFWRSQTYQELGNHQKAIEDYNAAVTLAPEGTMCCLI
ncbi:MAG: tetratricopeptide repeat protein [Aulosira sp. DedQUE10]|nr:tetratricopeptide repeat protein [Aulosira sp. DedQUE10]